MISRQKLGCQMETLIQRVRVEIRVEIRVVKSQREKRKAKKVRMGMRIW
jgi:hypothetical protein